MKANVLLFAGTMLLLCNACINDLFISGNGIPDSEERLIPSFSSVSSEGDFEVHITSGENHNVLINAESNLLPYIRTDVDGRNLKIHVKGLRSLKNRLPVEVYVTVPYIEKVVQSGSGSITTAWFEADKFEAVISGSGKLAAAVDADQVNAVISGSGQLVMQGAARHAELIISGSGRIDAWDLSVNNCDARISGSGDVWIDVTDHLKAVISGSGNVFYSGTPVVESSISGSGRVIHKN